MHFQPHDWHWKFGNKLNDNAVPSQFCSCAKGRRPLQPMDGNASLDHAYAHSSPNILYEQPKERDKESQPPPKRGRPKKTAKGMEEHEENCSLRNKKKRSELPGTESTEECPQLYQPNTSTDRNFPKLLRLQTFLLPQFLLFPLTYPRTPKPQSCLRLILR